MNIREKLNRIFELSLELTPDYDLYREDRIFPSVRIEMDPIKSRIIIYCYEKRDDYLYSEDKTFIIYIENSEKGNEKADECIAYLEALLDKEELV